MMINQEHSRVSKAVLGRGTARPFGIYRALGYGAGLYLVHVHGNIGTVTSRNGVTVFNHLWFYYSYYSTSFQINNFYPI